MKNTIAIIGRPNVGKSTLFNRLNGRKISIVDDTPGVTRDRLYEVISWLNKEIKIIDTGGIEIKNAPFQEQIQIQAKIAIEEADVIFFVFDGHSEISNDDLFIMNILRKANKTVLALANKLEGNKDFDYSWYKLGVDIFPISALHGEGLGEALDEACKHLFFEEKNLENNFKLSIIGKPNAGKSSLLNKLTNEYRSIVSEIPGTTRDSVKSFLKIKDQNFEIIDTAGIMRKSKLVESVDHYALMRAMSSLVESDLTLIVIDATIDELSHFDSRIIGYALEHNKPIVIVINKWDLVEKNQNTMMQYEKKLREKMKFSSWMPVVFISAKSGSRIDKLIDTILQVRENLNREIKPNLLANLILEAQLIQPAISNKGGRLHIYYARKEKSKIPTFTFFVNNKKYVHFSYMRFLEKQIRENFDFRGCPIVINLKNKSQTMQ